MSDAHGVARDQLRAFIERIERLEEEKKTIADDIKDVYGEAKGMGYDTKIMKKVIALQKKEDPGLEKEYLIRNPSLGPEVMQESLRLQGAPCSLGGGCPYTAHKKPRRSGGFFVFIDRSGDQLF